MPLTINPPLLNSANPWATTLPHLHALYASPHTGAITTRTTTLTPFPHDPALHKHTFYSPVTQRPTSTTPPPPTHPATLNTLGYSPHPLSTYLAHTSALSAAARAPGSGLRTDKPVIISVAGTPDEVAECYLRIAAHAASVCMPLAVEVNLSCPNIAGVRAPAGYSGEAVGEYLRALAGVVRPEVVVGVKVPPFVHAGMFGEFVGALAAGPAPCPVGFVTAVNTLGGAVVFGDGEGGMALPGGVGGMAGAPLHALALGNVRGLVEELGRVEGLRGVMVIGVGGVEDGEGWRRMRRVGAEAVGVGSALGRLGVGVFERIWMGVEGAKL